MRRIWDTHAPDPESLWRLVKTPGTAGFSRRSEFAKPATATVPDPHSKTPRETPLVDRDSAQPNAAQRAGDKFSASFYKAFKINGLHGISNSASELPIPDLAPEEIVPM